MGAFRKAWTSAFKKAGVSGLLFHDLRRTAVRNMIRAGIDKTVAKKISGHRTDAIFDRYNITSDEDIRDAMQKNETYVSGLAAKSPYTTLKQVGSPLISQRFSHCFPVCPKFFLGPLGPATRVNPRHPASARGWP
jgi:integrase-like protein